MNASLHALIYCRPARSSARALQMQQERCEKKAADMGATETVTIVDRQSRGGLERPAVQQMRSLLATGTIDLVVVDSPERLSRRLADLRALSQDVSRAGARLVFVAS